MVHHNIDYVQLHAIFPESYPFEPPFVRVISPYIERGELYTSITSFFQDTDFKKLLPRFRNGGWRYL